MPAASRSTPPISSRTPLRSVVHRRIGSEGAPSASASASASGRLVAEQVAQLGGHELPRSQLLHDLRRDPGGARHRIALAGLELETRNPRVESIDVARDQRRQRGDAAIGADRDRAQRRGGDQLRIRLERRVQRSIEAELP